MNREKLKKLVLVMLKDHTKIISVTKTQDNFDVPVEEYYFAFPNEKYSWSILKNDSGNLYLFFYPDINKKSIFIRIGEESELQDSLQELFELVRNKLFGFDSVLDELIS